VACAIQDVSFVEKEKKFEGIKENGEKRDSKKVSIDLKVSVKFEE
jgi:hypothetical protein